MKESEEKELFKDSNEPLWYVVATYNGLEETVKRNILSRVESFGMQDKIFQVLVPTVKVQEKKKNGEIKEKLVRPYSGYVFVQMIYTKETWFMIRNTPQVSGFCGSSGGGARPVPLLDDEIAPILKMCGVSLVKDVAGKVGDKVQITGGGWAGNEGVISSIDTQKEVVVVEISMLGRTTPVEVGLNEIKIL